MAHSALHATQLRQRAAERRPFERMIDAVERRYSGKGICQQAALPVTCIDGKWAGARLCTPYGPGETGEVKYWVLWRKNARP